MTKTAESTVYDPNKAQKVTQNKGKHIFCLCIIVIIE